MKDQRTTMADIARKCSVHVTTVSLALRNSPRLPEQTRLAIQDAARSLGYAPDPLLRALVSYRHNIADRRCPSTIAYITNWDTCWGWKTVTAHPNFYDGARRAADELGFKLEHFWMREPGLTHGRLSQILRARGINGVIIASHVREIDHALRLDWDHFSAVKIDYFPHEPALHNVTNNQCDIIRLTMRRVIAAGYRRIGFVMHRGWDHSVDHLWTAGYLCEQQNLSPADRIPMHLFPGPEPVERWMNQSKSEVVPDLDEFRGWLEKHRPEVVISKGSFVLPHLRTLGLEIPRDIAFADVFLENFDGAVAGVRQNHETVGALALETLSGLLQHNKRGVPHIPKTTFVEGTWFDGATLPAFTARGASGSRRSPRATARPRPARKTVSILNIE
jgi:LacI family transcriptional regulator